MTYTRLIILFKKITVQNLSHILPLTVLLKKQLQAGYCFSCRALLKTVQSCFLFLLPDLCWLPRVPFSSRSQTKGTDERKKKFFKSFAWLWAPSLNSKRSEGVVGTYNEPGTQINRV